MTRDQRRDFQQALALAGEGCGLLLYQAGVPVAWCQFGRAPAFPRYERSRFYAQHALPSGSPPPWRIMCLFVDKHHRREGLSKLVLKAALAQIEAEGGGIVEAFPLDVPKARHPQYTGSVKMYQAEGFQEVARLGKSTILMRRHLA